MEYKAYLKQVGEGCDYTIGCAQTIIDLESKTPDEAMIELTEIIADEYNSDESKLDSIVLYEISNTVDIDIKAMYATLKYLEDKANNKSKENAEKKEYERLKAKFS